VQTVIIPTGSDIVIRGRATADVTQHLHMFIMLLLFVRQTFQLPLELSAFASPEFIIGSPLNFCWSLNDGTGGCNRCLPIGLGHLADVNLYIGYIGVPSKRGDTVTL